MQEDFQFVRSLIDRHGNSRDSLLPILQDIIKKHRTISDDMMLEVASVLDISAAHVYGTASFYSFLDTKERGEFVIRVCRTITCSMKGKNQILKAIEDSLNITVGETTKNKRFTLLETNCLGWCHKGPAMLINEEVYTELTPEKVTNILEGYKLQ